MTGNKVKFDAAAMIMRQFGIELEQVSHDFTEIQASGEEIARHKAQAAYDFYKQPLVISDDSWDVPALNGFPGAFMHQINDWFSSDDWLRLMQGITDRRITLIQHVVYQDEHGQLYNASSIEGVLLEKAQGTGEYTNLTIISFDGGKTSRAQNLANGQTMLGREQGTAWHQLGEQLTS